METFFNRFKTTICLWLTAEWFIALFFQDHMTREGGFGQLFKMNRRGSYLSLALTISLLSCSQNTIKLPDEKQYQEDTTLMLQICDKFAHETDAKKLNKAAAATQFARIIVCFNYNGECSLYGEFLALATQVSAAGDISAVDRQKLMDKFASLKHSIETGRVKLHEEIQKKP